MLPVSKKDEEMRPDFVFLEIKIYRHRYSSYNSRDWARLIGVGFRKKFYDHIPNSIAKRYLSKKVRDIHYKFTLQRNSCDKVTSYYYFWRTKQVDMAEFISNGKAR